MELLSHRAQFLKEPGAAEEPRCFAAISLAFLAGAGLGALATYRLGIRRLDRPAALLAAALSLFAIDEVWVGRRWPLAKG